MFGKFINKLKSFGNTIDQLELNVSGESRKFVEIFERNLALEQEIAERTAELNQANKSILTLQHIWKTMNSAEPLSETLKTIVNGLTSELGYIYSLIFQIYVEDGVKKLRIRAAAQNNFGNKVTDIIEEGLDTFSIPLNHTANIMVQSIQSKNIITTRSFSDLFEGNEQNLDVFKVNKLDKLLGNRSISVLPIISKGDIFGCLVAISIRKEICDTEKNFLSLFAGQIELAVTIAGLFETIREQAITDGLTGLYNRRYFDQCLISEADRAMRLKQPFTLITLDLDHLKFINDTYGHAAGDAAICTISTVLKKNARSIDLPSRFGGEEFGIVLPGIDVEGGLIAAERMRAAIEESHVDGVGKVTASLGVATFLKHTDNIDELLEMCDQAMYKAKRNGRNQVQLASKDENANWQQLAMDTFVDILGKHRVPINRKLAKDLTEKLKSINVSDKSVDDMLYYVVDSFTKTYDPSHRSGITAEKIRLSEKLAIEAGLSHQEIDKIKMAILVYDIGNIMMPESILLKPGPLEEDEKRKILQHPVIASKEILSPISSASEITSLVEHHHERWDGSGYPNNLAGEQIPVGSRIIVIVDAYFALINDRPYRKAYTHEEALKVLEKESNKMWDGRLVELFTKIIKEEQKVV